jgi:hypothetical protein
VNLFHNISFVGLAKYPRRLPAGTAGAALCVMRETRPLFFVATLVHAMQKT